MERRPRRKHQKLKFGTDASNETIRKMKKEKSKKEQKEEMKNMKAGSPSNGPFQTPPLRRRPCPPRPKNRIFTKGNRHFYNGNCWTFFCRFWRLLGPKKERKRARRWKNKEEQRKNKIRGKIKKRKNMKNKCEISKYFLGFWHHVQHPRRFPGFSIDVIFFDEILHDFHGCCSECVSFQKKSTTNFVGQRFSEEKWHFSLDVKQNTHFAKRKSMNNFSLRSAPPRITILLE